jgi:hypothetical protein
VFTDLVGAPWFVQQRARGVDEEQHQDHHAHWVTFGLFALTFRGKERLCISVGDDGSGRVGRQREGSPLLFLGVSTVETRASRGRESLEKEDGS